MAKVFKELECKDYTKYKAKRAPKCSCLACWTAWNYTSLRNEVFGFLRLMTNHD